MSAAFDYAVEEDVIDGGLDAFKLEFPVRLGFRAMETKENGIVLGEEFTFEDLASFLCTDAGRDE